jgi:hypothetical protein
VIADSQLVGADTGYRLSAVSQEGLGGLDGPFWNIPLKTKIAQAG